MPYIKAEDREKFKDRGTAVTHDHLYIQGRFVVGTPGELNYMITLLAKEYLDRKGLNYTTINDIMGALESCKLEFYRRIAVPYEEQKIKDNGDVYT